MTTAEDKELRNKTKWVHLTRHSAGTNHVWRLRSPSSATDQQRPTTDRQTDRHDAVSRAASEMQPYSQQIASLATSLMNFSRLRSSAGH